jgi:Cu+-exporting ATPase
LKLLKMALASLDFRAFADGVHFSWATMRNIKLNLAWPFGCNVVLIPITAGVLVLFIGQQLTPIMAAETMAISSIFVLFNAVRLRNI